MSNNIWSKDDIERLRQNYCSSTNDELQQMFPSRSALAIYKKGYSMGLRKPPEIEFKNRSAVRKMEKCVNWKGGVKTNPKGYRMVLMHGHPKADRNGYVLEHIAVFEAATGISVPSNCCIHHINGDKSDNRLSNLCMMEVGAHTTLHHTGMKRSEETREKIRQKARARHA